MPETMIDRVCIRQSAWDEHTPGQLASECWTFVEDLMRLGLFEQAELPRDAVLMSGVALYMAQVLNGGVEQYARTSDWREEQNDSLEEGLAAIGAVEHLKLFRELRAYADEDSDRARGMRDRGGFGGRVAEVEAFDDRFFELYKTEDLEQLSEKHIRTLPNVNLVPDGDWEAHLIALGQQYNPHLQERHAVRQKEEAARHKLQQAKSEQARAAEQVATARRVKTCAILSKKIGHPINSKHAFGQLINVQGKDIEAMVLTVQLMPKLAYFELDGRAGILSYPEGKELVSVDLARVEKGWIASVIVSLKRLFSGHSTQ